MILFQERPLSVQPKNTTAHKRTHEFSLNACEALDRMLTRAKHEEQLKAEYIAVMVGLKPEELSMYRTGKRPLPLAVAARIDNFLGRHDLFLAMAVMEGISGLSQDPA